MVGMNSNGNGDIVVHNGGFHNAAVEGACRGQHGGRGSDEEAELHCSGGR